MAIIKTTDGQTITVTESKADIDLLFASATQTLELTKLVNFNAIVDKRITPSTKTEPLTIEVTNIIKYQD